jgi:hypothetical protein
MIELITLLGGGLLRLLPELLSFLNKKTDNKHELEMLDKQYQLEQSRNKSLEDREIHQNDSSITLELIKAQSEAMKGQMQITGFKFADSLNFTVRPVYAYTALLLYYVFKGLLFISVGFNTQALLTCYTPVDFAFLTGITSFYFVGRVIDKVNK